MPGAVEHAAPGVGPRAEVLRRHWHRFLAGMKDTSRRNIYFSAMAIPGHLLMAGSKAVLLLFTFSAFMTANVLFTFGLAVIKLLIIGADRRARRRGDPSTIPRAYRMTGLVVLVLSVAYIVSCLPLALGADTSDRYSQNVAIAIAAIAFVELGFSIHGLISSRRRKDLLMEAVKLSNLAASFILLVLAQTALLSMTSQTTVDPSGYNGVCGIALGAVAAAIGGSMLARRSRGSDSGRGRRGGRRRGDRRQPLRFSPWAVAGGCGEASGDPFTPASRGGRASAGLAHRTPPGTRR